MTIQKKDILGYLIVLNSQEILNRLTFEELQEGREAIVGCYSRLMEALEKDVMNTDHRVLYLSIQRREYMNLKILSVAHSELVEITEKTAKLLFAYLKRDGFLKIKNSFISKLDAEFKQILSGLTR